MGWGSHICTTLRVAKKIELISRIDNFYNKVAIVIQKSGIIQASILSLLKIYSHHKMKVLSPFLNHFLQMMTITIKFKSIQILIIRFKKRKKEIKVRSGKEISTQQ